MDLAYLHWMAQYWKRSIRKEMGMRKGATHAAQLHWKMLSGSLVVVPIIAHRFATGATLKLFCSATAVVGTIQGFPTTRVPLRWVGV